MPRTQPLSAVCCLAGWPGLAAGSHSPQLVFSVGWVVGDRGVSVPPGDIPRPVLAKEWVCSVFGHGPELHVEPLGAASRTDSGGRSVRHMQPAARSVLARAGGAACSQAWGAYPAIADGSMASCTGLEAWAAPRISAAVAVARVVATIVVSLLPDCTRAGPYRYVVQLLCTAYNSKYPGTIYIHSQCPASVSCRKFYTFFSRPCRASRCRFGTPATKPLPSARNERLRNIGGATTVDHTLISSSSQLQSCVWCCWAALAGRAPCLLAAVLPACLAGSAALTD